MLHGLQNFHQVDEPGALESRGALQVDAVPFENSLDLLGFTYEFGANGEKCRNRAGDVRRGHTGPGLLGIKNVRESGVFVFLGFDAGGARYDPLAGANRSGFIRPAPVGPREEK